ncbi:MAG: LysR family transcriptional regulator [Betaproteobacteria bacterium]|jgi:DNA-binding transcriptional LysR family regulator|nr:LysR family transcriptional regulator [Betaproteobacteria bacterium]NBS45806.1 LysR family transcriptional regulator [Betaproteobacteria bacterium]
MAKFTPTESTLAGLEGLNLNLLRYLLVLVQEGSVSKAADRVYVTQPAMSAALKRLRDAFGDPILVRSGQVMAPTPRAKEIAAAVDQMLQSVNAIALDSTEFNPGTSQQRFTLMCSDYVQFAILSRLSQLLVENAPGVDLAVRPANPEKIEAWMESGQVDIGIGYVPDPPVNLRARLLFGDEQACLVRKGHPVTRRRFTPELYAGMTHVAISPGGAGFYGARIDHALRSLGIKRRIGLTLPSFLAIPYVVASTDFIATIPVGIAQHFTRILPLQVLAAPVRLPAFEISMYWHQRVHADPGNVWLRKQIVLAARQLQSSKAGSAVSPP